MDKVKTFDDLRSEQFGATDGEEFDMRNMALNNLFEKVNEIVEWINDTENGRKANK